ncbi:MAG: ATP synthase F1 subunit delta [Bacteroidota bacterium]
MAERAAYRYANSILQLAVEMNQVEIVAEDFLLLHNALASSRELALFLSSPIIQREKKKKIIRELFASKISTMTLNFLSLLTSKAREKLLPEIVTNFQQLNDKRQGIVNAAVTSATDFTPQQTEYLSSHFNRLTKKNVKITFSKDKTLISGFVTRIGDTVWDASVKRQLQLLEQQFIGK